MAKRKSSPQYAVFGALTKVKAMRGSLADAGCDQAEDLLEQLLQVLQSKLEELINE